MGQDQVSGLGRSDSPVSAVTHAPAVPAAPATAATGCPEGPFGLYQDGIYEDVDGPIHSRVSFRISTQQSDGRASTTFQSRARDYVESKPVKDIGIQTWRKVCLGCSTHQNLNARVSIQPPKVWILVASRKVIWTLSYQTVLAIGSDSGTNMTIVCL